VWKAGTSQEDLDESAIIVLVGKYTSFADSYISVIKSLEHTAKAYWRKLKPSVGSDKLDKR
jgi:CTP synthase